MGGLTGCDQQTGPVAELTESFQKRIDDNNKELATLRASDGNLRAQLAEAQAKVQALQGEVEAARAKPALDVPALARELAPLLAAAHPETVQREDPVTPAADLKLPDPKVRPGKPAEAGRVRNSADVRATTGEGSKRKIEMEWGPVSR
ncbi:MAG: hypothetical protein QOE70_441 [Chthoniobacter sp.]|jgi:hypothetical protein|nr:hypothetical protein [Chthoniobacter sp.]